jgi:hypothetical protein
MNDVTAPKQSSLRSKLVEATMFLKVNMSLIPNNPTYVTKSSIWNTLIPCRLELLDDIGDSNDNEIEEDDDDDDNDDDDLSLVPIKSEETNYTCLILSLSISLCNNMKIQSPPRAIQPTIYCLVSFEWISLRFIMNMHVTQLFS